MGLGPKRVDSNGVLGCSGGGERMMKEELQNNKEWEGKLVAMDAREREIEWK